MSMHNHGALDAASLWAPAEEQFPSHSEHRCLIYRRSFMKTMPPLPGRDFAIRCPRML